MINNNHRYLSLLVTLFFLVSIPAFSDAAKKEYRVYEFVIESVEGTFEAAADSLSSAIAMSDWKLLTTINSGVPEDCGFRAIVFVLYDSTFAAKIMDANHKTGAYGTVDRINLFEDENGFHVSIANRKSTDRTVLLDDESFEGTTKAQHDNLRLLIESALKGTSSNKEYGQKRKKGYIGRTMGVMAGGSFDGKIGNIIELPGANFDDVVDKVRQGLSMTGEKWGMHLVYELNLPGYKTVVFGSTGTPMDRKSFDIVKAGSDKSRKKGKCPGIAHAAAFPIEIVVQEENGVINVSSVNAMYRMKMYFEDAGKWAFMKNMTMPGSIGSELEDQIEGVLEEE